MREGMSILVARAKIEKMRLAREPRRTASSMMIDWSVVDVVLASSGAASVLVSRDV
jgi:hypothetical protein